MAIFIIILFHDQPIFPLKEESKGISETLTIYRTVDRHIQEGINHHNLTTL
jgi:hypothetical protein